MDPNFWFSVVMVIITQFSSSDYIRVFENESSMRSSLRVVSSGYPLPISIVGRPEQVEVPNWKAFYLLKIKRGIVAQNEVLYDYPTATQVVEMNNRIAKENSGVYQFYGDQAEEKWYPDETTTSKQITDSIPIDNIYGNETGIRQGKEDWSQSAK